MNRLFWIIVSVWFAFSMQACSGSSSSSNEELDPDEIGDDYGDGDDDGRSSGSRWEKRSSGVVQKDSLGRPISSAADPDKPGEPGEPGGSGNSSSSTGAVVGIEDPVIEDTTTVVDVEALPECTAQSEGESFLVKSENILYFCLAGEWVPSEEVSQATGISCRDGKMYTGVEDDDEKGSSSHGGSSTWGFGNTVNTDAVDTAEPRIVGAHLVGVAEKGPFRYGTSIKLIELDSTQHLADSKRTHKTCILNGDGNYSFDSVDYVSPYLRVKANGYYRSELTGGLSSKAVTLEAVVDVTEKDTVNVNILTHMEAERVLKLVENSGNNQPIRAVKAQALRDILSSFDIQWDKSSGSGSTGGGGGFGGWNFGGQQQLTTDGRFAEDIGLFDGDEYSGALLAISIMMQRKGSGSEMMSYAAGIADRIKGNGNWDDNNAKADLADWLMVLDTSGSYATIRNNIASWNMGEVPDFEKHLKRFWSRAYNFGDCNAQKADSVFCISNSLSAYFCGGGYDQPGPTVRFICDANTHEWRAATAVEKDTYGYGKGEYPGQIKNGRVDKEKYYVYDDETKKWRAATSDDIQEFEDLEDVYKNLKSGEKVIFFLRHAKRSDDTGKNGHLTDEGKAQSQGVGAKLKGEDIYFANSTYTRSMETCENVAKGAGVSFTENTIEALDGEWYVKDNNKLEQYKSNNGGGWVVASEYAYKGSYTDAFYDLGTYSESFITEIIKPEFANVKKVGVFISHDMFVVPLTAYFTDKKVNLRYFDTKQWINYLAGLAIIMGKDGTIRYVPVRGLDSGTMTM
ncbi:histidine phosphatase family protein [Fibrobacter succinogenes]|uniref:histidine phosphatase family protein n=1 Tax=Fibrobacter succinogenes TaxID=833 RepID=UPI0013D8DFF3|nr:histidine phosphatase family protein [Fibrobacter succinogenes]